MILTGQKCSEQERRSNIFILSISKWSSRLEDLNTVWLLILFLGIMRRRKIIEDQSMLSIMFNLPHTIRYEYYSYLSSTTRSCIQATKNSVHIPRASRRRLPCSAINNRASMMIVSSGSSRRRGGRRTLRSRTSRRRSWPSLLQLRTNWRFRSWGVDFDRNYSFRSFSLKESCQRKSRFCLIWTKRPKRR